MPTFNSRTECVGTLCIVHDSMPDCHPVSCMDAWMNSKLKAAFVRKEHVSLTCLACFLKCYPWMFLQSGTGRRPVDCCRNKMHVLYMLISISFKRFVSALKRDPFLRVAD